MVKSSLDEKQKQKLIDAIIADNPQLAKDNLQLYYIERMVESYLIDPDAFNRTTTEVIKQEKKAQKEGDLKTLAKPAPTDIVCISKVETLPEDDL